MQPNTYVRIRYETTREVTVSGRFFLTPCTRGEVVVGGLSRGICIDSYDSIGG